MADGDGPVKKTGGNRIGEGKPGPGRPPGSPNKTTAMLKDAVLEAAAKAGGKAGLVGYLKEQADKNPTAFMSLLGKAMPLQVQGSGEDGAIITEIVIRGVSASR